MRFINLSDTNTLICLIISINCTSLFLIIGLKINSIHYCKNIDHNITNARNNTINNADIVYVTKQHMLQITSTYIICIIVLNLVCAHLFVVSLTLNLDGVPQNINQYQCSTDSHIILKALSGA